MDLKKTPQEELGETLLELHQANPQYTLSQIHDHITRKKLLDNFYYPPHGIYRGGRNGNA